MTIDDGVIPLMRPLLPKTDAILPYLREIDENRWYSNFGPLVDRFEQELARCLGVPWDNLVCVTSGTEGLILALRTRARAPSGYCLMPSWTFAASAGAVCATGMTPYFIDVSPETWALDAQQARSTLRDIEARDGPVSAIMPVSPFGAAVDIDAWDAFELDTGVPVIIDAAAAFDAARFGASLSIISLHATKAFGIGEGAVVVSRDPARVAAVRSYANFGFDGSRDSMVPGINAKITEYAAAVGLAALVEWPEKRQALRAVMRRYAEKLSDSPHLSFAPGFESGPARTTCDVMFLNNKAMNAARVFEAAGVKTRQWWGRGCHTAPAYSSCPRTALPVTERLRDRVLGLPMSVDLSAKEIDRVCGAVNGVSNG
jgi:dTDP-4-amino-4,6-dideoxygalactose transaminase